MPRPANTQHFSDPGNCRANAALAAKTGRSAAGRRQFAARTPVWRALAGVSLCLLAACTVVGPDYPGMEPPALPSAWDATAAAADSRAIASWWDLFSDPTLAELIEQGARQNLSLEAAGLRIVQARAALGISDALLFPQQQQLNGNASRLYRDDKGFNAAAIGLDVGWEMDIWGKYARGIESAEANLYATIASYRDVLVTISAEIARNYINYRTAQERIYLSRRNIAIQQRVVDMTQVQFDSGNVSELDVQQASTQLYTTMSALPALNITRLQARNAIAVLLGARPEDIEPLLALTQDDEDPSLAQSMTRFSRDKVVAAAYKANSVIPEAPEPDQGIDPQLILRRPDLQVAELRARAQSARTGFAEADLYPRFYLFGSIGLSQTVRSGTSFDAGDAVTASIGPGLSWDIFQYGRIKNTVRIEDARFEESLVNYNQNVLEAVREVSDALEAYRYNLERSEYDFKAVQSSIRAFNISANQYNNGLVSYQRLLSTVEKMTVREDAYAQTRGSIANQVVALYKALGGGWEPFIAQPLVKPQTVEQMKSRIDWGDYLEPAIIVGSDRDE
jgi:outer membrane protein TolC